MIALQKLMKIYQMGDSTVHALDGVSLFIGQGEFVLDLESATHEELSEKISSAWENREAIANKLQASVAAKQSALAGLDEILRALISVREVG